MLALESVGSPFMIGGQATVEDVLTAIVICSGKSSRLWMWLTTLRCTLNPSLVISRLGMFRRYLAEAQEHNPRVWCESAKTRAATTPPLLMLKRDLMVHFGYTEAEALAMPIGKATWERYAWLEAEGAISFRTDADDAALELAKKMAHAAKN